MAKRGLGSLKNPGSTVGAVVPALVGLVLAGGVTVALRLYLRPQPGQTSEKVYSWAPFIGAAAGLLGAIPTYYLAGKRTSAAAAASVAAVLGSLTVWGMERLHASKPGAFAALMPTVGAPAAGATGTIVMQPTGAIVPEYSRTGSAGEQVQLNGVLDTSAFGRRTIGG